MKTSIFGESEVVFRQLQIRQPFSPSFTHLVGHSADNVGHPGIIISIFPKSIGGCFINIPSSCYKNNAEANN